MVSYTPYDYCTTDLSGCRCFDKKNGLCCCITSEYSAQFCFTVCFTAIKSHQVFKALVLLHGRRDGVVVRASASQSVDLGFIPLVESYQEALKNGIYSFLVWRSAFMGGCGEQAGKFACCVLGQGT